MLKLGRGARGHFVTLIANRVLQIRGITGHSWNRSQATLVRGGVGIQQRAKAVTLDKTVPK